MSKRVLTLFGRQGCHLCDAMLAALKPCLVAGKVTLQMVDVDGEPDLKVRFDTEVPLLFEGELEIAVPIIVSRVTRRASAAS